MAASKPPYTWQDVFSMVMGIQRAAQPQTEDDRHAFTLLWAGLKHFGAPVDLDGFVTPARRARAAKVLVGSKKELELVRARKSVEAALTGARMAGQAFAGFDPIALLLCDRFGRPATDAPTLAHMLANCLEQDESVGTVVKWLLRTKLNR